MQFLYHQEAGKEKLYLENEAFKHLKVRRIELGEILKLSTLKDDFLYLYELINLNKHSCELMLKDKIIAPKPSNTSKLALAVIEPKIIEKILPFLNELGLHKLIFVYAEFSQGNFKLDFKRFERILIGSCQQCGRRTLMQFELFKNTKDFLKSYPNAVMVDFNGADEHTFKDFKNELFFIGCEGGFSDEERELFKRKLKLSCPHILKSQSASMVLATKLLT